MILCKEAADEAEVSVEPPAKKKVQTARDRSEEELDEAFGKLKEKHANLETMKLCLWAKLIQVDTTAIMTCPQKSRY